MVPRRNDLNQRHKHGVNRISIGEVDPVVVHGSRAVYRRLAAIVIENPGSIRSARSLSSTTQPRVIQHQRPAHRHVTRDKAFSSSWTASFITMQAPAKTSPRSTSTPRPHAQRTSRAETTNSLPPMASLSAVVAADRRAAAPARRGSLAVARAAKVEHQEAVAQQEARTAEGRRAVMLAAAVAAVAAIGGAGVASAEEPKKGSPEAKKYAPVCITMPTAKICHN
jgi:hypothetical protein